MTTEISMWAAEVSTVDRSGLTTLAGRRAYCSAECLATNFTYGKLYLDRIIEQEQYPLGTKDPIAYPFESDRPEWCYYCGKRCNLGDECDGDKGCASLMKLPVREDNTAWICKHGYPSYFPPEGLTSTRAIVTPRAIDLENEGLGKIIIPTATHGTSPGLFKFKEDFPWAF